MLQIVVAAAVIGVHLVVAWNAAQAYELPTWPSRIVSDVLHWAWLPSTIAAGLVLRGRRWLLLPPLGALVIAAFLIAGVPDEHWNEAEPILLAGVALVGVVALALGSALAKIVAREAPQGARDWVARHARVLHASVGALAALSLAAVIALLLLGQLDDAPNGPAVPPRVQARLGHGISADQVCYRPEQSKTASIRRSVARDRRVARKRLDLLLTTLRRSPDPVVTVGYYASDRPDGPGPFYSKYTIRELATELAEDGESLMREGDAIGGPTVRSCYQRLSQRLRAALGNA